MVDKGYHGVKIGGVEILRSGQRQMTRAIRAMIKRRSAIEPTIGLMKIDGKLSATCSRMCWATHYKR